MVKSIKGTDVGGVVIPPDIAKLCVKTTDKGDVFDTQRIPNHLLPEVSRLVRTYVVREKKQSLKTDTAKIRLYMRCTAHNGQISANMEKATIKPDQAWKFTVFVTCEQCRKLLDVFISFFTF